MFITLKYDVRGALSCVQTSLKLSKICTNAIKCHQITNKYH